MEDDQATATNPALLTLGREACGWTQSELARRLKTSQGRVSKVEEGLIQLDASEFERWLTELRVPASLWRSKAEQTSPTVSLYRRTAGVPVRAIRRLEGILALRRLEILHELNGRQLRADLPKPAFQGTGKEAAARYAGQVRRQWNVAPGPFLGLARHVERTGCIVDTIAFEISKVDAVMVGPGTEAPMIFLNQGFPPDRMRLSLAHELGHLLMHHQVREGIEEEAWEFASELLMPAADIFPEFGKVTVESLIRMKARWQVSMGALLKRASSLGAVSPGHAQSVWIRMSQYGFRKQEPNGEALLQDLPTPLQKRLTEVPA